VSNYYFPPYAFLTSASSDLDVKKGTVASSDIDVKNSHERAYTPQHNTTQHSITQHHTTQDRINGGHGRIVGGASSETQRHCAVGLRGFGKHEGQGKFDYYTLYRLNTNMAKCQAKTLAGAACKGTAQEGSSFCFRHAKSGTTKKTPEKQAKANPKANPKAKPKTEVKKEKSTPKRGRSSSSSSPGPSLRRDSSSDAPRNAVSPSPKRRKTGERDKRHRRSRERSPAFRERSVSLKDFEHYLREVRRDVSGRERRRNKKTDKKDKQSKLDQRLIELVNHAKEKEETVTVNDVTKASILALLMAMEEKLLKEFITRMNGKVQDKYKKTFWAITAYNLLEKRVIDQCMDFDLEKLDNETDIMEEIRTNLEILNIKVPRGKKKACSYISQHLPMFVKMSMLLQKNKKPDGFFKTLGIKGGQAFRGLWNGLKGVFSFNLVKEMGPTNVAKIVALFVAFGALRACAKDEQKCGVALGDMMKAICGEKGEKSLCSLMQTFICRIIKTAKANTSSVLSVKTAVNDFLEMGNLIIGGMSGIPPTKKLPLSIGSILTTTLLVAGKTQLSEGAMSELTKYVVNCEA
jgi:hypothetical protein